MTFNPWAKPLARRMCAGARRALGGASAYSLLRWCRQNLPGQYAELLPRNGTWMEVVSGAERVRVVGFDQPRRQAAEAAIYAKAICMAVAELRSERTRPRQRRRLQQDVDWGLVGSCQLCQRAAPGFQDSGVMHFCSVHQPGTSAYKRAHARRDAWDRQKSTMYAGFPVLDAPWRDYAVMPFRAWLERWFPLVADRYGQDDAESLMAALDDGAAPVEARQRYHAQVLASAKRLVAFLVDAESWWMVDPLRGGGPVPPRQG